MEFDDSPQTFRTYRKEAERLLLWSLIEKQTPLSSLNRDDLRDYQTFLTNPEPMARWCGMRKPRLDKDWRPFQGPLSEGSVGHAITIINALFSYLVEAGYLAGNPLGLMRRKAKRQSTDSQKLAIGQRFLEQPLWQLVVQFIEAMPQETLSQKKRYERTRFLFHLLYLLGPRVSEVANAKMGDVKQLHGKWWWEITGKGNKTQLVPVNDALLHALMRYRQFYGRPPLPQPDETCPLLLRLNGQQPVTNTTVYRIVKNTFAACARTIEQERPDYAKKLLKASTHWLRHTAITHQTDAGIELRYIKRSARHESLETTLLYQHAEDDRWHEAMAEHQI